MSELTPEARAALNALRQEEPTAADEARVAAALFARLPVAPPTSPPPPAAAGGVVKALLLTVAVAGVGAAVWLARPTRVDVPTIPPPAPVVLEPVTAPPSPAPVEVPFAPPPRPSLPRPRVPAAPAATPVVETTPASPPESPPTNDLAAELQLLSAAREAATRSDWRTVLHHLAAHEQRFPRGLLSPERATLTRQAWCGLGQPEHLGPNEVCP